MFNLPFLNRNQSNQNSAIRTVKIADEFSSRLVGQDVYSGKTSINIPPVIFRETYLKDLDCPEAWTDSSPFIIFDFTGVTHVSPSFAFHAFAYFRKYATPDQILKKIRFINISDVKYFTIEFEITLDECEYCSYTSQYEENPNG